jgi:hypothetical protein
VIKDVNEVDVEDQNLRLRVNNERFHQYIHENHLHVHQILAMIDKDYLQDLLDKKKAN